MTETCTTVYSVLNLRLTISERIGLETLVGSNPRTDSYIGVFRLMLIRALREIEYEDLAETIANESKRTCQQGD